MPCRTSTSPASTTSVSNEPRSDEPLAARPLGPSWLDWQPKVWGWTAEVLCTPTYALHFLQVEAGGYCSIHRHAERDNRFLVRSGAIVVNVWERMDGEPLGHILRAGESLDVRAGVIHQFAVLESGSVWEVYTPTRPDATVRRDDIERFTVGGRTPRTGTTETQSPRGTL